MFAFALEELMSRKVSGCLARFTLQFLNGIELNRLILVAPAASKAIAYAGVSAIFLTMQELN